MTSAQIDTIQALENENKILADEVKMKEQLIPGMEKMIAYLQKVQQENKRLKEEWVDPATVVKWEQAQVWLEENKKLKEENKKLRASVEEEEARYEHCNDAWKSHYYAEQDNLKEEIKKLKGWNKEQEKEIKDWRVNFKEEVEEKKKLKEEVELLHDQLEDNEDDKICDLLECDHSDRYDAISELKQYCDKWSVILTDIDGDDFCNLLSDCGWEEVAGELVRTY